MGLGDLTVIVAEGLTLACSGHVGLGEIRCGTPAARARGTAATSADRDGGTGPAEVTVDANVGVGQITVVKE